MAPLLRSRGYIVTVAGTGHEAVELFERERPDLVILDLGLPDMDGTDVCRQVRERADTPILILSARGAEKDKVTALIMAPTTTSRSRSGRKSCWRGCGRRSVDPSTGRAHSTVSSRAAI
jgi:CheY-like chemotaxis protein